MSLIRSHALYLFVLLAFVSCNEKPQKKSNTDRTADVPFPSHLAALSAEAEAYKKLATDTGQMGFLLRLAGTYPALRNDLWNYIVSLPFDSVTLQYHLKAVLRSAQDCMKRNAGDSALLLYNRGVAEASANAGYEEALAMFYREIGRLYSHRSNYANAIGFYNKAITISEKRGLDDNNIMYISELGSIYQLTNEYEKALANFTKAREYGERTNNTARLVYALNSLGDLSRVNGKLDEAISYHERSMDIVKKESGKLDLWACTSLGKIYTARNELEKAEACFDLVIKEAVTDVDLVSQCYLNLSRCEHKRGLIGSAIAKAIKAYEVSLTSPDLSIRSSISHELALLYKEDGRFEKALEYFSIFHVLEDSLNNKEQIKKRAEIEYRHKEEKLVEKNELQLKAEKEKRNIEAKRNSAIIISIAVILVL
ncbi:MAG TPA: tetratricopeptide repeat protein, partial [Bacteroidia bacterium]